MSLNILQPSSQYVALKTLRNKRIKRSKTMIPPTVNTKPSENIKQNRDTNKKLSPLLNPQSASPKVPVQSNQISSDKVAILNFELMLKVLKESSLSYGFKISK